ncbi:hypothetical protein HS041_19405 [Planomonospora sp. ID67723]|uniref:hypothetical protein n=1 Tax=Planomonospora sp. ID67723 TaxID=2738134 RepID=UPI0018C3ACBB|nr:hypothetical protein [Planomonospora sp. ID67723]MBG0829938.1 hypothetical protein [Planomonospora sp. ID67723]
MRQRVAPVEAAPPRRRAPGMAWFADLAVRNKILLSLSGVVGVSLATSTVARAPRAVGELSRMSGELRELRELVAGFRY